MCDCVCGCHHNPAHLPPDDTTETITGDDTAVTTEGTAATLGGTTRTIPPADPEARDRFSQWGGCSS